MLYVSIIMVNKELTIKGADKIFQGSQYEMKDHSLLIRTNQTEIYRWTIIGPFWSMAHQVLNNFVNLSKNGIIYQYLESSRINQDFKDVQCVTELLKFSLYSQLRNQA